MVGLCNKVFPIVLSRPGLWCRAPQVKKFHKHSSTVNLPAQKKRPFQRETQQTCQPLQSAQRWRHTHRQGRSAGSRAERGAGLLQGSGPEGSCLEFLREIAGLSVLQRLQLVELATPCTNIEDLKTLITVYSSCSRECLISEVSKILPLSDINLA